MLDGTGAGKGSVDATPSPPAGPQVGLMPGQPPGAPLVRRLVALVAAVALPLLGLAAWGVLTGQEAIRRQAEQALVARVQRIALTVERDFDRAEAQLQALSASAALSRGDLGALEAEMRAVSDAAGGAQINLVASDGTVLLSSAWTPGERRPGQRASPAAQAGIAAGRPLVTNLFYGDLAQAWTVAVGLPLVPPPLPLPDGSVPAGIGLAVPRDTIATVLRTTAGLGEADAQAGWTASIVDRAGVSVARTAGEASLIGQRARPEAIGVIETMPDGLRHGMTTREGVQAVAVLMRGARSGFAYILTMPEAEFAAPLRAEMLRMLVSGGLVLAFGLALAALLARRTVAAFRLARDAAVTGRAPATGLREADALGEALAAAAADRSRAEGALSESERRNRDILESLGERLYALDAEGRLRFASRATLAGWGVPAEAVLGRRPEEVFPEARGTEAWDMVGRALAMRQESHLCAVSAITRAWVEVDAYPSADGGVTVAFREVEALRRATQDRARAAEALAASEERLRLALDAAELGAWELDVRAGTIRRSPRTLEIFGFPDEAELERYPAWRGQMHPEDSPAALATIRAALVGEVPSYTTEYRFHRPDGRWIWVESHGRVVARDPATGAALRIAGASRDITARRQAEQRQALLAREVDHRAKNALAVVQAAVRLTPKDDAASFARAIEGRIGALARAQTLLAADRWRAADLRALLEGELAAFPADGVHGPRAVLEGPPVALPAPMTQPLAMAAHELATNAVKHGALAVAEGVVTVTWAVEPPAESTGLPVLQLVWRETGGPPVAAPPSRRGFGSRVLEGTVRGQLGGQVALDWEAEGLVCRISLPLRPGPAGEEPAGEEAEPPVGIP